MTKEEEDRALAGMKHLISRFATEIRSLGSLVKVNPNTKTEIKRGVTEAERLAGLLTLKSNRLLTRKEGRVATNDMSIQTDLVANHNAEVLDTIEVAIHGPMDVFKKVMDCKWPAAAFKATREVATGVLEEASHTDVAYITSVDFPKASDVTESVCRQFGSKEALRSEGWKPGEVASLCQMRKVVTRQGVAEETCRWVYYPIAAEAAQDEWEVEEVVAVLETTKEKMVQEGRTRIALLGGSKLGGMLSRKLAERVFRGSGVEVLVPKEQERVTKGTKVVKDPKDVVAPKKRGGAILIKAAGSRTYSDLLREVKEKVDLGSTGAKVRNVRKTKDGDLLVSIVEGGDVGGTDKLVAAIKVGLDDATVNKLGNREVILHINGLDAVTSAEDVEAALRNALGDSEVPLKVKSMWPAYGGNQNAAVSVQRLEADRLIRDGRVKNRLERL